MNFAIRAIDANSGVHSTGLWVAARNLRLCLDNITVIGLCWSRYRRNANSVGELFPGGKNSGVPCCVVAFVFLGSHRRWCACLLFQLAESHVGQQVVEANPAIHLDLSKSTTIFVIVLWPWKKDEQNKSRDVAVLRVGSGRSLQLFPRTDCASAVFGGHPVNSAKNTES